MPCARGCCPDRKTHYRSLAFRPGDTKAKRKVTVDRTDTIEATTTEHWHDRQDVNVRVLEPVTTHFAKEQPRG